MINVDLADDATAVAGIVDWILLLADLVVRPIEQVLVGYFDLPAVANEVYPILGRVEVSLDPEPSVHATFSFDDIV